jgi:methionyl-tRNA synthetase
MKNFYLTTPIYYPSAKPHMGHAYSSISADVIARFKRIEGYDVNFLTGTDEHGLKIQRAAEKQKKNPKDFCDEISKNFIELAKKLNLTNTDFIRTTEDRHKKTVAKLWNILEEKDEIYISKYSGWYSVSDEAFYTEDEIEIKSDNKVSKVSGSKVEWMEEESYFFRLSKWQEPLLKYYEDNPDFISPLSRRNEVISFVKSGLKDLSISRTSFKWGIPVPNNKKHIIYVWLDALTNYISALDYFEKDNKNQFWPADVHIIGKDIIRFHCVYWPAFLLAAGINPPKKVFAHGWILSGEEKMSKSKGNILDPLEIIQNYGLDEIRYYLMKEVIYGDDGKITPENLINCINSDLANNIGNLYQRICSIVHTKLNSIIPKCSPSEKVDLKIVNLVEENLDSLLKTFNKFEIHNYLKNIIQLCSEVNKYVNDSAPWSIKEDNIEKRNVIIYAVLEFIRKVSILLQPIIPEKCKIILDSLNIKEDERFIKNINKNFALKQEIKIQKINILFKKQ